ncbi:hypothetical protein HELRODRAFT_72756 [Helobdella robusta]|uniref:RING-type domain-containing protein n=1 Tax=Helobdella robusta TaxID=6412 RepID=T1G150_HELRO|nr:hypothetical protein HELRODRAFT_72756 [Helobdella robusta]ESO09990.1 hypothetical protein HELRODRAFT_72756 [Helobdella robusta]
MRYQILADNCRQYNLPYLKNKFVNDECSICIEKFNVKTFVCELKCKHAFHIACITKWSKNKETCPLCREVTSIHFYFTFHCDVKFKKDKKKLYLRVASGPRGLI